MSSISKVRRWPASGWLKSSSTPSSAIDLTDGGELAAVGTDEAHHLALDGLVLAEHLQRRLLDRLVGALAVGVPRLDDDRALLAGLHLRDGLVEPGDDLAAADLEAQRIAADARVELAAVVERAAVVHDRGLADVRRHGLLLVLGAPWARCLLGGPRAVGAAGRRIRIPKPPPSVVRCAARPAYGSRRPCAHRSSAPASEGMLHGVGPSR